MAQLKKCPYCGAAHRKTSSYQKCKRRHVRQSWPK